MVRSGPVWCCFQFIFGERPVTTYDQQQNINPHVLSLELAPHYLPALQYLRSKLHLPPTLSNNNKLCLLSHVLCTFLHSGPSPHIDFSPPSVSSSQSTKGNQYSQPSMLYGPSQFFIPPSSSSPPLHFMTCSIVKRLLSRTPTCFHLNHTHKSPTQRDL